MMIILIGIILMLFLNLYCSYRIGYKRGQLASLRWIEQKLFYLRPEDALKELDREFERNYYGFLKKKAEFDQNQS